MTALRAEFGNKTTSPGNQGSHGATRRVGLLTALNRRLARMSTVRVTALLLSFTVAAALAAHLLLAAIGLQHFDLDTGRAVAIVTVVVGAPTILYAQNVIRELLASRRALRLMTERLAWALNNAEQANEAKSAFMATMSHELRTPLNAIIGFSDIMAHERLGPLVNARYRGYAEDINASGTHLLEIINDILDLAKIESGQPAVEGFAEMKVLDAVKAACAMVEPMAEHGRVYLKCRLPEQGVTLVAVERMVRQILVNVLSNAVKFTPEGGSVRLEVALNDAGDLSVTVTDTGVGMSAEDIKVALTPFGQIDSAPGRRHGGTGLGLPLAKSMMEMQGGLLRIESVPGEGSTIELLFPAGLVRIDPTADEAVTAGAGG